MTFLVKNWSKRIKKKLFYTCKRFTLFPNLIITMLGNFGFTSGSLPKPLILGDGGKKIYKNVLLLTDFDSKYRHKIKSLDIGKSIS